MKKNSKRTADIPDSKIHEGEPVEKFFPEESSDM